jgi:hypothetical protein
MTMWMWVGMLAVGCRAKVDAHIQGQDSGPSVSDSASLDTATSRDTDEPGDTGSVRPPGSDTGSEPVPVDNDGDGFTALGGDCNDDDHAIHPGAYDVCGDRVDNDCDGAIDLPNCGWYPDCYARCAMDLGPASYWRLSEDHGDPVAHDVKGVAPGVYRDISPSMYGVPGALATDPNTAIDFSDLDGRVEFGDVYDLGFGDWTYGLWFKTSSTGMILGKSNATDTDGRWGLGLHVSMGGVATHYLDSGLTPGTMTSGTTNVADGAWHSMFFTLDRDGVGELYVDGVIEATLVSSLIPAASLDTDEALILGMMTRNIGAEEASEYHRFDGVIDEVTVWPSVLSLGAIVTLDGLAR